MKKHAFQALMAEHQAEVPRSRRNANEVKRDLPVNVVIGNPPYREKAKGLGGWVEKGNPGDRRPPLLSDFRAPGLGEFERALPNLVLVDLAVNSPPEFPASVTEAGPTLAPRRTRRPQAPRAF